MYKRQALGGTDESIAASLAVKVEEYLTDNLHNTKPSVEQIQDAVEKVLIEEGHARTAKEYILYRAGRTRVRETVSYTHLDVYKRQGHNEHPENERCDRLAVAAAEQYKNQGL